MPTLREVATSLFGAYRLAMMDPRGLEYFDRSTAAAIRSFFAAVLMLPFYTVLVLLRLGDDEVTVSLPALLLIEGIAYVISWTAFALVMDELSRFLDRGDRYPVFLSAYNWSAVLQMGVYLPAIALGQSGLLPAGAGETLMFTATLVVLAYQWFITQVALELPGFTAAGLVLLDLILSVFISGAADGML